jgi:hypothetical protein
MQGQGSDDSIAEGDTRSLGIRDEEIVKLLDQSGRELLAS